MPKPTETEIKQEFTLAYEGLKLTFNPSFWFSKAFVKIAEFLYADESSPFWAALEVLETAMQTELKARTNREFSSFQLSNVNFDHGRTNKYGTEADPTKHLLTSVLTQFEIAEGFKEVDTDGEGHPRATRFLGQLSSDDFAYHIRNAHLAKDYVGLEHGEYTHRIQWYCIGQAKQHLGLTDTQQDRDKIATLFMKSGPFWGKTFDRNIQTDTCDFRKPENLNNWLVGKPQGGGKKFPLLHNFLKARRARMGGTGYTAFVLKMMIAKHIFPGSFAKLSTQDLEKYKSFRSKPKDAQYLYNTYLEKKEQEEIESVYNNKVLKGDWSKYAK